MDNNPDKFWTSAKAVSMSGAERAETRDNIYSRTLAKSVTGMALSAGEQKSGKEAIKRFIRTHPLRTHPISEIFARFFSVRFMASALIVLVAVSAVGGSIVYAAESALPGDVLYPVKVSVTEPLRENLRLDKNIRARWAEKRLKRRLSETEVLLNRGGMSDERLDRMQEMIAWHKAHLEERMKSLPEGIPDEIQAHIERRIQEHIAFLDAVEIGAVPVPPPPKMMRHVRMQKVHIQMMRKR